MHYTNDWLPSQKSSEDYSCDLHPRHNHPLPFSVGGNSISVPCPCAKYPDYLNSQHIPSLEPTLNELVSLQTDEDSCLVPQKSASSTTTACQMRRIGMSDIEQTVGQLQGSPHFSVWTFKGPRFVNNDSPSVWRHWAATAVSDPFPTGLVCPRVDDVTVDPWELSRNMDAPLYRVHGTSPLVESGVPSLASWALYAKACDPSGLNDRSPLHFEQATPQSTFYYL